MATDGSSHLDPFLARVEHIIGAAVQPLQSQISHLYQVQADGAQQYYHPPQQYSSYLGGAANAPVASGAGGNASTTVLSVSSGAPAGQPTAATPADRYMEGILYHLESMNFGRGRGRGRGGRGFYNNSLPIRNTLCSLCRDANARCCNHCLICHEVTHGSWNCPKKNDPNFTPLN